MIQQFIAISDGKVAGSWLDFVRARKLFTRSPNILKKNVSPCTKSHPLATNPMQPVETLFCCSASGR